MTKNPFIYGEVVTGSDFADRKTEQEELIRDLQANGRIFLISPRRYGKTSLIIQTLNRLKKEGFLVAYLDLYRVSSLHQFLNLYARTVAGAAETTLNKMVNLVRDILPGIRPKIDIKPDGSLSLTFDYSAGKKETEKLLEEVYDLPEKLAKKKKTRFVLAFDEFQEIRNLNGESAEKVMRAAFQHHHNTAYLFAGSKRHLLFDMVKSRNRPFYKMGKILYLQKIPRGEFLPFLNKRFSKTGYTLEKGTLQKILDVAEEYPYNVQFLCHELWNQFIHTKKIKQEDIETALEKILAHQTPIYYSLWDHLPLHQRRLLQAIACSGGKKIYSQDFVSANKLGALSSVQTSLNLLMKKDLVDKEGEIHFIMDVFFKEWIKKKATA